MGTNQLIEAAASAIWRSQKFKGSMEDSRVIAAAVIKALLPWISIKTEQKP